MSEGVSSHAIVRPKSANDGERELKVVDIVCLINQSVRRLEKKMVRLTEVLPGADGVI